MAAAAGGNDTIREDPETGRIDGLVYDSPDRAAREAGLVARSKDCPNCNHTVDAAYPCQGLYGYIGVDAKGKCIQFTGALRHRITLRMQSGEVFTLYPTPAVLLASGYYVLPNRSGGTD